MTPQEVSLRGALEDLREASNLSVQALRDMAVGTTNLRTKPGRSSTAILGAIDAATHRLAEARKGFLASLTVDADSPPSPSANAAKWLRNLAQGVRVAKGGEDGRPGDLDREALAEELAAVADTLEA